MPPYAKIFETTDLPAASSVAFAILFFYRKAEEKATAPQSSPAVFRIRHLSLSTRAQPGASASEDNSFAVCKVFEQVGCFLEGQTGHLPVGHQRFLRRPQLLDVGSCQ